MCRLPVRRARARYIAKDEKTYSIYRTVHTFIRTAVYSVTLT